MPVGIFWYAQESWPIEFPSELSIFHKFWELLLDSRMYPCFLHSSFGSFQLHNHLSNLVVEMFVELMHGSGEVLYWLHKFSIDWNACTKGPQLPDFGQHAQVFKLLQRLFDSEVERGISGEDVEVVIVDIGALDRQSGTHV